MGPIDGINPKEVDYFNLHDYIDKIQLKGNLLEHVNDTSKAFDDYIKTLSKYDEQVIVRYLEDSFYNELAYSNMVEKYIINPKDLINNDVYFDSLKMSNQRIKDLHYFAVNHDGNYNYRTDPVRVSYIDNKEEIVYWQGAKPEDIPKFMDTFIKIYKENGLAQIDSTPFLKAALMSLLFVRIHPFNDGNGRTSRLIYDMKFTEMVNKLYGTNLKISPLHISMSIFNNKVTYSRTINNIYFDMEHDSNDEINKWFNFILNMADEKLFFMTTEQSKEELEKLSDFYQYERSLQKDADYMRIRRLK